VPIALVPDFTCNSNPKHPGKLRGMPKILPCCIGPPPSDQLFPWSFLPVKDRGDALAQRDPWLPFRMRHAPTLPQGPRHSAQSVWHPALTAPLVGKVQQQPGQGAGRVGKIEDDVKVVAIGDLVDRPACGLAKSI
jgi:hypothetical protein